MAQPSPQPPGERAQLGRDSILNDIFAIKVEAGKPLRQVQVPDQTYQLAKKFVLTAPNTSDDARLVRFKVLYNMPSGRSIYALLAADAGNTSLKEAEAKIAEWRDASKALLRYALNLLLAPKRPEFQRLKLSSSYYVYQVSKKLKGAEEVLQAMGYERVGGSAEVQELKYGGEVNPPRVAETAADLVILDGELDRIKALVKHAQNENIPIVLTHILQVRSHPTQLYNVAKYALADYKSSPVIQHHPPSPSHHGNTQPPAAQRQEASNQPRQPPFQHSIEDRASYPHHTQPPVTHGQQYSAGGDPPPVQHQHNTPHRAPYPPHTTPRYATPGGPLPSPYQHGNQIVRPNHPPQNSQYPRAQGLGPYPGQHPVASRAHQQHHLAPNTPSSPLHSRGPSSMGIMEQTLKTTPNAFRRGSAPAVGHHQTEHPVQGVQSQKSDGIYMNLPLLSPGDAVERNNQLSDIPGYVNVGQRTPKKTGDYEDINLSRGVLFSPPDPNNFPEPIVQSQSELERLNMITSGNDFSPISIVDPRSDPVDYSGPYMESLMSIQSPEQMSIINRQAEVAWRVETSPPPEQATANNQTGSKDSMNTNYANKEQHAQSSNVQNDLRATSANSASGGTVQNTNPSYVTHSQNPFPNDNFQNQINRHQPKDYKNYDKPVPDLKDKMFSSQYSNMPTDSNVGCQETASEDRFDRTSHQTHSTGRSRPDVLGASNVTNPALNSTKLSVQKRMDCKPKTTPLDASSSKINVPSDRPHTSPHSSLDSGDYVHLSTTTESTLPDCTSNETDQKKNDSEKVRLRVRSKNSNSSIDESFEVLELQVNTSNDSRPTEQPSVPSVDTKELLRPSLESLGEPRSRADAVSMPNYSPGSRKKGISTHQKSLDTELGHVSLGETDERRDNHKTSNKHIRDMSKVPLYASEEARNRSDTHTDLDRPGGKVRSPQLSFKAKVSGTRTCSYCTNMVFEGDVCDVCGNKLT